MIAGGYAPPPLEVRRALHGYGAGGRQSNIVAIVLLYPYDESETRDSTRRPVERVGGALPELDAPR